MDFEYSLKEFGDGLMLVIESSKDTSGFINNVGGWLASDVQCFAREDYLPRVKEIMESDGNDEEEFEKNAYVALVRKDYTTITYIFEADNPHMVPCTLPTKMLYEILEIWAVAEREHAAKLESKYKNKDNS